MRAEFLRIFSAERERVGWIDAAGDHAHERFILLRFWPRHLLEFQHFGRAIFVRDDSPHHWLFVRADCGDGQNCRHR